ncbi:ABC transporter ATP-binding protein [Paenirhodobacter sp.]|uniref:ABC transporter ATP-binding protein n=1 Tax=Paenirhodobacter sp. TaxID=1965326 RepID=UPI003B402906
MLDIKGLYKNYGEFRALSDINISAESDEFVCLLGPSGCGKTTLLRIIAGLEEYQQGTITLDGRDLNSIEVRDRGFGIVFQSYSLFPNMTVARNIGYGLKLRGHDKATISAKVDSLLQLLGFPHLAGRYPHELSGGQQQRVAIGRALAVDPSLLLLDEPLSALDAKVRHEMRDEIRQLQRRLRIPTIMVTHDQDEALSMADKVVCMNHGLVEQVGTPQDLYFRPRTKFVAGFIGTSNFFDRAEASTLFGVSDNAGTAEHLFVARPEELSLRADEGAEAMVEDITFLGKVSQAQIRWRDRTILGEIRLGERLRPGDCVAVGLLPEAGRWVAP